MDTVTPRRITSDTLRALGACSDWTDRFRETFPNGVGPDADPEAVATAYPFPVRWAFDAFKGVPSVTGAWATYEEAIATAWATYEEARATAWSAYETARAPAWATYETARATAWAAYREVRVPAEHTARAAVTRAVLAHLANGGEVGGAA